MTNKFKLIGYKNIFENFIQLYDKNCLPNKILLTGNKGIGKSLFVKHFLSYIYSINDINKYNFQDFEINNLSKSSILIENNSHPNIFNIFKKNDKKNIEISQIREMIQFLNKSSFNNKIRFIIVNDLQYFNLSSTNAILKSLEEPNNNVIFILINDSSDCIQDTLKSRCIEFKLFLNNQDVKLIVNNYFNENVYDLISKDFQNIYNSPSFLISLITFFNENDLNIDNCSIEQLIIKIIKNKFYLKNQFINQNLNFFIELFFFKNINHSKNVSFQIKEYFYLKLSQLRKYNLDLETFFIEFEEKLLSE